ncbi:MULTISPECIES: hypothetical protein [Fischerella]|nr:MULTISPECIES: hypothetical protein [Fischerella]MBD2430724.1 hypothetical protein [Fischerella sp. FACHB-380]
MFVYPITKISRHPHHSYSHQVFMGLFYRCHGGAIAFAALIGLKATHN